MIFFCNDTATTEIYTLSLHDALPIYTDAERNKAELVEGIIDGLKWLGVDWDEGPFYQSRRTELYRAAAKKCVARDRKSTRLNSSHGYISYAVFCLKTKHI